MTKANDSRRRRRGRRPLHEDIARKLRAEILRDRRPGDRIDPEPALAARFGVSIVTIRNATLLLANEGLVRRRHGSGTYVCDRRATRHVGIAVCVDAQATPHAYAFHLRVAGHVWAALEEHGCRVKQYVSRHESAARRPQLAHEEMVRDAQRGALAALVALQALPKPLARRIAAAGVPMTGSEDLAQARVGVDYDGLVRDGVRALAEAGRERIGLIGWGAPQDYRNIGDVFLEEMASRGLSARAEWIRADLPADHPGSGWSAFREIWTASREKPDGLLICDDVLYRDAATAIWTAGVRVPDDLMVVTHCNRSENFGHSFPVTVLEVDDEAYVQALVQATLECVAGRPPQRKETLLRPRLIEAAPTMPAAERR